MEAQPYSPATYVVNFLALSVLTVGTVALSLAHLGAWHLAVGGAIGVVKAGLVVLVFMQLARGSARTWLVAGAGLFWLAILVALTMADYLTRSHASY
jgi:cytochrome c oxidase subunit 4